VHQPVPTRTFPAKNWQKRELFDLLMSKTMWVSVRLSNEYMKAEMAVLFIFGFATEITDM
jgi:hypothetical protein